MIKIFKLTPTEAQLNIVQLAAFCIFAAALRDANIARWISEKCSVFPTTPPTNYDPLSIIDWISHYSVVAYGIGVLQVLVGQKGVQTQPRPRQKSYSLVFAIQQFMGLVLMLSHSLVNTNPTAEHALLDFGHFLLQISNFATGFVVCFPFYGWVSLIPITYCVLKEQIMFQNVPGIVLNTFALVSILASPQNDFSSLFKLSYVLMSLLPAAAKALDTSTDFGHTMLSTLLLVAVLCMRISHQKTVPYVKSTQKQV